MVNSTITVTDYDQSGNKVDTGNLELRAPSIDIDATSKIVAKGAGYKTPLCGNGSGPSTFPAAGGRGGCSVKDSGGGGAHFGIGGRGTRDNPSGANPETSNFYENDCSAPANTITPKLGGAGTKVTYDVNGVATCRDAGGTATNTNSSAANCRDFGGGNDAVPTVAGQAFYHSIYSPEFGAAGGDKGCLDGDGYDPTSTPMQYSNFNYGIPVGGSGGGRIVLVALTAGKTGLITLNGTLNTNGKRGCGSGNDSGGGGAGGTVFVVGDHVTVGATAVVTAQGGLGGDTQGLGSDPTGECVAPRQQGQTADDCGGGGGGGIVSVLSGDSATIDDLATFNVNGNIGGVSTLCKGEAGGGVGELQISGGYVGEFCDGFDNDFNGMVDDLPPLDCNGMATTMMSCVGGIPQQCPLPANCLTQPVTDSRTRFTVIVDTSGSMLGTLDGTPTFGDGSVGHPGLDRNGTGGADDSRLYKAKTALTNVISAYPNIDFALARYHQDQSVDRSCQEAHNFECNRICCTYDNPTNNTAKPGGGDPACTQIDGPISGTPPTHANFAQTVNSVSPLDDECVNYAGNCGPPRRGADVLVPFGSNINTYLSWLDGQEDANPFDAAPAANVFCAAGKNCELRASGPTPLANSLQAADDYMSPIKACDMAAAGMCRQYGVILLTDGAESCQGDPVAAATALNAKGIHTYVVGFSTLATETTQLNAIAAAGGSGSAFIVGSDAALANALATIVSGSIVFETCNNLDDDCDGKIDEDFPEKGNACDDGKLGTCKGTGHLVCDAAHTGLTCAIDMPGTAPTAEVCNGLDDNCNGAIDEGISCTPGCVKTANAPLDPCNGVDDDCDGRFEEDANVGNPCGSNNTAPCHFGATACIGGNIVCVGAVDPQNEICNGLDDNCDGVGDNNAPCPGTTSCVDGGCRVQCAGGEFPCPAGFKCDMNYCVPTPCAQCAANEVCQNDQCIDPCAGVTCGALEECRFGTCVDCNAFGCPASQICVQSMCVADPCKDITCSDCASPAGCSCNDGTCVNNCDDTLCPSGERCNAQGTCQADACAGIDCDPGLSCQDGQCRPDACDGVICPTGQACIGGQCYDDPCKVVTCSAAYHCELRDDVGLCVPDNPAGRQDLVQAAGGGGCNTGGGSASALLIGLAAFIARRRRVA
jgi:hypothetical protein